MDIKLVGEIIQNFKSFALIIDKTEKIIWFSPKIKNLFTFTLDGKDIEFVLGCKLKDIANIEGLNITIGNDKYKVSKTTLTSQDYTILVFDLIDNFNNPSIKAHSLEQIIDSLYDGVLLSDKEGRVVIYNPAMEELEQKQANNMIGKYIWDAYGYSDKNKSEHMQVFSSGQPIIDRYKAHAYNNGNPIYKSYSTLPIEKNGEIIGVYSISKNESKLQSLLSEIVELKRQFKGKTTTDNKINLNGTRFNFADIIGSSECINKLIKEAQTISWLDNSILLIGDTGTGKEVFAQSIHNFSKRKAEPFIGINCSAIPENLLETILFGSVKGAYTGSLDSSGLFEEAGEGTIFLDELNSIPINMQTKLLRVLQEKNVRRVGGKENHPIKCRVISAMNIDPYVLIEEGKLRQDLFYRIAGYNLYIPPLKERENDLFELADYYISKCNHIMNKEVIEITKPLRKMMDNYSWPGNIRELEHFIENIMLRTSEDDRYLRESNIPSYILDVMRVDNQEVNLDMSMQNTLQEELDILEKKLIIRTLDSNRWNVSKSAEKLGVTRQSLIYRMRKLEIDRK